MAATELAKDDDDADRRASEGAGARRLYVGAAVGIAVGLAIAGSLDQTAGGVVVLASWLTAIAALHKLGRAGSDRRS